MRIKVHIFLFTNNMITLINFWQLWSQKSRTTKSRSSLFMYHLIYSVILFSVFSMLLRIFSWLRVRFAPSAQMLARSATSCDFAGQPRSRRNRNYSILHSFKIPTYTHKIWNVQYPIQDAIIWILGSYWIEEGIYWEFWILSLSVACSTANITPRSNAPCLPFSALLCSNVAAIDVSLYPFYI